MVTGFSSLELLVYYLIVANFIAFTAFGIDKALAEGGGQRISEATLLLWAFIGGTLGAYAGRDLFRHKTRKQPFSNQLHGIAALQLVVILLVWIFGIDAMFGEIGKIAGIEV